MKKKHKIIALTLIVVLGAYLALRLRDIGEKAPETEKKEHKAYEPKFKKEGELWFLDPAEKDTVVKLDIELAESREEIEYGLMYRRKIDENTGMLFIMGSMRPRSFWMKNTYVSLDIIYIDDEGKVVSIQEKAEPLSEKGLPSKAPASHVLEVKGGFCENRGIDTGYYVVYEKW